MSPAEKRKWGVVAVLAAILAGILWYQRQGDSSPAVAAPVAEPLNQPTTPPAPTLPTTYPVPPLEEITRLNPFHEKAAERDEPVEETQGAASESPQPPPVPDWLSQGQVEAVLERDGERIAIISGRAVKEGQVIDGWKVVRITSSEIVIEPIGAADQGGNRREAR